MRKSMSDMPGMFTKEAYPGLPEALKDLSYYVRDAGHCIMAIPSALEHKLIMEGPAMPYDYEVPMPTRYVLEKGWKVSPLLCDGERYIIVDAEYDPIFGVTIPEMYYEYGGAYDPC